VENGGITELQLILIPTTLMVRSQLLSGREAKVEKNDISRMAVAPLNQQLAGHAPIIPAMCGGKPDGRGGETVTGVHRLRHLLCRSRSAEGQTLLEFALVIVTFMLLIFGVFDFGHLFFVRMNIQNSVQESARFASTGNHLPDPNNPGNDLSRVDSIISTLQQSSLGADITNIQISSLNGGKDSAGGPGDMMTVAVTASVPLLTPMIAAMFPRGRYVFTTSVTIKNEPFPASATK
jgi:TadE-like protein